ncbi:MAG: hypothetical protein IJP09_02475 [Clostridia bacterium]|nr:hypothetical protein [Clostridia bacterium]
MNVAENASEIKNAVFIHSNRFVECSDGTFVDLEDSEKQRELHPTSEVLAQLNTGCGIWKIDIELDYLVKIYANDGNLYTVNEVPHELHGGDYDGGYDAYLKSEDFLQKEDRLTISAYEKEVVETDKLEKIKTDIVSFIIFDSVYHTVDSYDVILNEDGTVSCDCYPEVSEWKDVVDIDASGEVLLALTSDGKVFSAGTDFNHENVVMIDIIETLDFSSPVPVALTFDGRLLIGDYPGKGLDYDSSELNPSEKEYYKEIYTVVTQAEFFTDVVDFYASSNPWNILVQKSDGSLWATYNDYYDPEYVNILGREDFLSE